MMMCKTKENRLAITHIDSEEVFFSCEQEGTGALSLLKPSSHGEEVGRDLDRGSRTMSC